MSGSAFLLRTLPDGTRQISWRLWLLVWVTPALFLLAAAAMFAGEGWRHLATKPTTGEVVRVYEWEGDTPFDRGTINYSPVFGYVWSDGQPTEASSGMSHPDFNFPVGAVHEIRYFPGAKRDIVIPGMHNWMAPLIILGIGAATLIPALAATAMLRRWRQRGGRTT